MNTTNWPQPAITGMVRVYVAPSRPLDTGHADLLHAIIGSFLDALRLRMLPGTLLEAHSVVRGDDGKADARLAVANLDLGSLRVLYGMLSHFSVMVAPLGTMIAWCEPPGSTPNLLDVDAPLPGYSTRLPFHATLSIDYPGAAPRLAVEVGFGRALTDEEQNRLGHELRVWVALVHGGYPKDGGPPGSSAMGPIAVRFDAPNTLRFHADAFLASVASFESLKALVVHWSSKIPVMGLDAE